MVARRLLADPVGIVFATREPGEDFSHLRELQVRGLVAGDARALLRSSVGVVLHELWSSENSLWGGPSAATTLWPRRLRPSPGSPASR